MIENASVSVIIPTWNRAATIEKAVCSALTQTVSPLEVLICDDGSSDNTREVIQSIKDPHVRWIAGPHAGRPAIPRNRGIKESRGEWLAFLDSDDEWLPEKLEKQLRIAKEMNCKAVCSNAQRFIPGKGIEGNLLSSHKERITFDDLLSVNRVICSSALIHRSLLGMVEGFPEGQPLTTGQDYALWLRVSAIGQFSFLEEPLLVYRDDPKNGVRDRGPGLWPQRAAVMEDFIAWGKKQDIPNQFLNKARQEYLIARIYSCALKARNLLLPLSERLSRDGKDENSSHR